MSKFKIDEHKLNYHLDRVHQWKYGDRRKVFPIYVEISPVGYCNHRCTFCALDYVGYQQIKLGTTNLKFNIMDMALHEVRSIMFAGEGEPLLHPDIAELVGWTDSNGIDVAITTNAVALTRKFTDEALEHCSWIKVSCNAGDAQTYAEVHGTRHTDWAKVWLNLKYAVDERNRRSLKTAIGVQCLLLPENAHTLPALARQCRDIGVDYLVIKPYSQHRYSITKKYAGIEYKDIFDRALKVTSSYANSNFEITVRRETMESWDENNRKAEYGTCHSTPFFWAYIMASGDVYGCSAYLQNDKFNYGNINDALFSQVWLGDKRDAGIHYVKHELDIAECRKNCRMHKCNSYLWDLMQDVEHKNFI